jgi:crotonobetainyl-CoA:carnitine CoA-transferase CaiB-like acyl-CoA transferase
VENFKAGTLEEKFGIGYRQLRELNPRLIYVANTGFGQWGPFSRGRASYDGLAQAVSGLTAITGDGEVPTKIGNYLGDWFGASMSALGVLAALRWRDRTGEGQFVEMAQCEGLLRAMDWTWLYAGLTGRDRAKAGNGDHAFSPAGVYRCSDGYVAMVAGTDGEFRSLCRLIGQAGLAKDPRFASRTSRRETAHARALEAVIGAWCARRTRAQVEAAARKAGIAAAPVMTAKDQIDDPHLRARRSVWEHDDPVYGQMVECGPAPKLSATPARIKWAGKPVGFHNEFVLRSVLGLDPERIRALYTEGAIGRWAEGRRGAGPPEGWKGEGVLE